MLEASGQHSGGVGRPAPNGATGTRQSAIVALLCALTTPRCPGADENPGAAGRLFPRILFNAKASFSEPGTGDIV